MWCEVVQTIKKSLPPFLSGGVPPLYPFASSFWLPPPPPINLKYLSEVKTKQDHRLPPKRKPKQLVNFRKFSNKWGKCKTSGSSPILQDFSLHNIVIGLSLPPRPKILNSTHLLQTVLVEHSFSTFSNSPPAQESSISKVAILPGAPKADIRDQKRHIRQNHIQFLKTPWMAGCPWDTRPVSRGFFLLLCAFFFLETCQSWLDELQDCSTKFKTQLSQINLNLSRPWTKTSQIRYCFSMSFRYRNHSLRTSNPPPKFRFPVKP